MTRRISSNCNFLPHRLTGKSYLGFAVSLAAVALAVGFTSSAVAQKAAEQEKRPRLPNHYAKVVTDNQRGEINAIQAEYAPQITKLRDELAALTAKRDAAIEKVLSTEQRKQVNKLRSEAAARRQAANGAPVAPADENAGSKSKAKKAA